MVLNDRPFGNALAVSFFRRRARLRSRAYYFHCSIEKRSGKIGRDVSFNEGHVLNSIYFAPNMTPSRFDNAVSVLSNGQAGVTITPSTGWRFLFPFV